MSRFFRKLNQDIGRTFRKSNANASVLARKMTNTANMFRREFRRAGDNMKKIDRVIPNPITKAIIGGLSGAEALSTGVAKGGVGVRSIANGQVATGLRQLGDGVETGFAGGTKIIGSSAQLAPLLFL